MALSERFSTTLSAQATNLFNHFSASPNFDNINDSYDFGVVYGNSLNSRQVEIGLIVRW